MARIAKPLTDKEIKAAKPRAKEYKLFDGGGLYLSITPKGQKWWRIKYRFEDKEKRLSLGVYPATTLGAARAKREEIKEMIAKGIDPAQERKADKETKRIEEVKSQNTFYTISQAWLKSYEGEVSESYHAKLGKALENYCYPTYTLKDKSKLSIKDKPIDEVTRLDVIAILEALKDRGIEETARRTAMLLGKVFKYAVTHEVAPHNIMADIDLPIILGKKTKRHYPTLSKKEDIRGLLLAIDGYTGNYYTRMALRALPYLFVRSFNIRHMEWSEIDLEAHEWIIPADKMKTKTKFVLPLPRQVIALLEELQANATNSRYVFPSFRSDGKPMSDNTLISALRRMGYTKEEFVPHSFRSMFATIAYEYANHPDGHPYTGEVIEACLAHKETNKIKEAYNRSSYKEPMRGLMQWYADFLEGVKHA